MEIPSPAWDDIPNAESDALARAAMRVIERLEREPELTAEQVHEMWVADKERDGWQYGPIKDREAKTHPCLKPFHELPLDQVAKDIIYLASIKNTIERYTHGLRDKAP